MKEKVKKFYEDHKQDIRDFAWYSLGFAVAWYTGRKLLKTSFSYGLERCMTVKPELSPMLDEALTEALRTK